MGNYLASVWAYRYFWISLVKNDMLMRYRRSILGIGWSFMFPLAQTFVLCTVFAKILQVPNISYFAPHVLTGITFWAFLTRSVLDGCDCYVTSETYIRQHPLPIAVYPLRTTLGAFLHFVIAMLLVIVVSWVLLGFGNLPTLIFLIPGLAMIFLFCLSVATIMGFINAVFRDAQYITELGFQVLFYLTPIIYTPDLMEKRHLGWVMMLNPFAQMLKLIRDPILDGRIPSMACIVATAELTAIVMGIAALSLRFQQKKVIFYL